MVKCSVLNCIKNSRDKSLSFFRKLILNQDAPSLGLTILLVSKAAGIEMQDKQNSLAKITEMIRSGNIFHNSVINISKNNDCQEELNERNKLFLLMGDYLFSKSFQDLGELQCHEAFEIMFSAIRDAAQATFIEPHDRQNQPLPAPPTVGRKYIKIPKKFSQDELTISEILGNVKLEWASRHLLANASLLGKGCQAAVLLEDHSKHLEESAYIFGINLALAMQIRRDISYFNIEDTEPFSLLNAPLMFDIPANPNFYETLMEYVDNNSLQYNKIKSFVLSGSGIEKSLELKEELVSNGLEALKRFPNNEATASLFNILRSI